ncbi:ABC transporter permease [Arenimonas oryziterrae]|uniref:Transport permease protein n=1 Tax=Arenimonas oryziterrae DSM 21050 = YC6267 TaxID=1121015 RepID=A0A091AV94_9GAMM|nr:ABC transporter permease [Arenimonas oryziterrae]KFN43182.1 hypothetical protein N789_11510 [Arenimonas oryziterrae DSM 21050 = YC6267]
MTPARRSVFRELLRRELGERYRWTLLGGGWYIVLPLVQLAVLAWVFGSLLPARAASSVPYGVFLALALWPWSLFSNAVGRNVTVLIDNASLIGKIAVPYSLYINARMAASVLVDLAGFALVLVVVALLGVPLHVGGLPAMTAGLAVLLLFTLGASHIVAVLQVFLRDVASAVGQLLSLGFFLTPIIYDRAQLPPPVRDALGFNPFTAPIEAVRHGLLGEPVAWAPLGCSALAALALVALAWWLTERTRAHLEDFL